MADIMTSIGLDINDFKGAVNQLQESTAKLKTGVQGNMLAMAAGILGVGATVYTFAKQSGDDFDGLIARSKELSNEFKNLASDAGFSSLTKTLSESVKLSEELAVQEAKSAKARENILHSFTQGLVALTKGKGLGDIEKETQEELGRLYWDRVKLMQRVTEQSDYELKLSQLKLKGADDEVESLNRKAKLEREIAEIIKSSLDAKTKATLIQNKEQIAANEDQLAAAKKQKQIDDQAKRDAADVMAANRQMQQAEQELIDNETRKLSLKDQSRIQSGKIADAEFRLSKAAKGTAEWYERKAELTREQLKMENLLSDRAKAYEKSHGAGRRFDREQEKARKDEEKGRARLQRQIDRENRQPAAKRPQGAGGQIIPKPVPQPQAPAAGGPNAANAGGNGNAMKVETLIVGTLKHK